MLGGHYKDTDASKLVGWGYQNPINSVHLTFHKLALEPLLFFAGNTMKRYYGLTSFYGCTLS